MKLFRLFRELNENFNNNNISNDKINQIVDILVNSMSIKEKEKFSILFSSLKGIKLRQIRLDEYFRKKNIKQMENELNLLKSIE